MEESEYLKLKQELIDEGRDEEDAEWLAYSLLRALTPEDEEDGWF